MANRTFSLTPEAIIALDGVKNKSAYISALIVADRPKRPALSPEEEAGFEYVIRNLTQAQHDYAAAERSYEVSQDGLDQAKLTVAGKYLKEMQQKARCLLGISE